MSNYVNLDSSSLNTNTNVEAKQPNLYYTQTDTLNYENYNLTTSLTSSNNIFINIINTITYQNYEGFINREDINQMITLDIFYKIMQKCFKSEQNYSVLLEIKSNMITLNFEANLDGFFRFSESISIKEKVLSDDKILTVKLTEMESRHQREIEELQTRINELMTEEILFGFKEGATNDFMKIPRNIKHLDLTLYNSYEWFGNYYDFNKLYNLSSIKIFTSQFYFNYVAYRNGNIKCPHGNPFFWCSSCSNHTHNSTIVNWCELLNNSRIYLPKVKTLEIVYSDGTGFQTFARTLPNLKKITFSNFQGNALNSMNLIKNTPTLTQIEYINCINISNFDEIKTWCASKGIKIDVKSS